MLCDRPWPLETVQRQRPEPLPHRRGLARRPRAVGCYRIGTPASLADREDQGFVVIRAAADGFGSQKLRESFVRGCEIRGEAKHRGEEGSERGIACVVNG